MGTLEALWIALAAIRAHKLRSFLTTLGVVFGVGSVVSMLAVGEGASAQALEQIRKLGSNNILFNSVKPAEVDDLAEPAHARPIQCRARVALVFEVLAGPVE